MDASILVSDRGVRWLERLSGSEADSFITSAAFRRLLGRPGQLYGMFQASRPQFGGISQDEFIQRMRGLEREIDRLPAFDHTGALLDDARAIAVMQELLNLGPIGEVWADEWAFLNSHSWLVSRSRAVIEAFRDAGAGVIEFRQKALLALLQMSQAGGGPLPPGLSPHLTKRIAAKWIVAGGAVTLASVAAPLAAGVVGLGAPVMIVTFDP